MMPFFLPTLTWMKSNWRLLAGIALAALLVFAAWKIDAWRRAAVQLNDARKVAEAERQKLEEELAAQDAAMAERERELEEERLRSEQFAAQAASSAALEAQIASQIDAIGRRRDLLREEISELPDDALEPRIKRELGLRRLEDETPGFYKQELQLLAQCVTQYPSCEQQRQKQADQISELANQVKALSGEVGSVKEQVRLTEEKYQLTRGTLERALEHYATLYNAVGPRKRSPKCLWLWNCAERQMPVPKPEELRP